MARDNSGYMVPIYDNACECTNTHTHTLIYGGPTAVHALARGVCPQTEILMEYSIDACRGG